MLEPLKQFICDTCKHVIELPDQGWIEWLAYNPLSNNIEINNFRIVHHFSYSPLGGEHGCYQHAEELGESSNHLHHFMNDEYKMAKILYFLDIGPQHEKVYSGTRLNDMRQFVETVRRLTIPYYEEARLYWDDAIEDNYFSDANEIWVYSPESLKGLIEKYS